MAKTNYKFNSNDSHSVSTSEALERLKKLALAHLLWEDQFYIDGKTSAEILKQAVGAVPAEDAAAVALLARSKYNIRHVGLFIIDCLVKNKALTNPHWLADVIQRPDEMAEFLSLYWGGKKTPIANKVKQGLALAFNKFNEYQLAKHDYNNSAIKLRDVMFLSHPQPDSPEKEVLFRKIANNKLETPDTWEVSLSTGGNKKQTFERLISENKLGAMAFVKNLRLMIESGVNPQLIKDYSSRVNTERVLPFRFVTARKFTPVDIHPALESMMFRCLQGMEKLPGKTLLLVDVSGSMYSPSYRIGKKKDMLRAEAACALAILCRELCEVADVATFSNNLVRISDSLRGFELEKAINDSQPHGSTALYSAVNAALSRTRYDRVIIFTDGEATDTPYSVLEASCNKTYILNVASYDNSLKMLPNVVEIAGFSQYSLQYISELEKL